MCVGAVVGDGMAEEVGFEGPHDIDLYIERYLDEYRLLLSECNCDTEADKPSEAVG